MEIKNENIKKFLEKLGEDQELQAKFAQIRDPGEAYKLASSLQEGFTQEEFTTEMKNLYNELTKDLSEEDMEKVAGGLTSSQIAVISVGASIAGVASAAASF